MRAFRHSDFEWDLFWAQYAQQYKDNTTKSLNERHQLATFLVGFYQSIATSVQILTTYPWLQWDFQLLVDVTTGRAYHFDIDRAYELEDIADPYKSMERVLRNVQELETNLGAFLVEHTLVWQDKRLHYSTVGHESSSGVNRNIL